MAKKKNNRKAALLVTGLSFVGLADLGVAVALPIVYSLPKKKGESGDVTKDKKNVDKINEIIKGTPFDTMSDLLSALETKGIYLQKLSVATKGVQYVWDKDQNVVFLMNPDGSVFYAPKEENFEPSADKTFIWKMVKSSEPTKLHSFSGAIYADEYDEESHYSQYLRDGYSFEKNLTFCSGLDTGNHEQFVLTYDKEKATTEVPVVINTKKSSLSVNGALSDVHHYGNLTELTVDKLGDNAYIEHGTVDAAIVVRSGNVSVESTAQVNEIIVDNTDASKVKIDVAGGSEVGTIGATDATVAAKLETDIVSKGEGASIGNIETTKVTETPKEDGTFYSGDGTVNAPWTIKTKTHFNNFVTYLNGGEQGRPTGAACYFNLIADIDLEGQEWTPLCASDPYVGIFNGCGFTISNLKVSSSTTGLVGFFAKTIGTKHTGFGTKEEGWDSTNNKLNLDVFKEDNFSTILKNITFDNADIAGCNHETCKKKYTGTLVGDAINTLINNVHVTNSTISGYKGVGGIAGAIENSCIENCSTDANTEVFADGYNAGGIAGAGRYEYNDAIKQGEAVYNCVNNASLTVTNYVEGSAAGNAAGIIGHCPNNNVAVIIDSCTNNGKILSQVNEQDPTGKATSYAAGIVGYSAHVYAINNCTNNGEIVVGENDTESTYKSCAAGIATFGTPEFYNCKNTGNIHGHAQYLGGIFANWNSTMTGWAPKFVNCESTKQPETTKEGGLTGRIAAGMTVSTGTTTFENLTFANVDELSNAISSKIDSTCSLKFVNCTVTDTSGTLKISAKCRSIVSDTKLCSNVIPTDNSVEIDIPDTNITISGDHSANSINVWGKNSSVTIEEGASINNVTIGGENSTCTNNGTINGGLVLAHLAVEATNNGTINGGVSFNDDARGEVPGHSQKKLTNNANGIINNSNHTISAGGNTAVTIDNYGTISNTNAPGGTTYLFLWYNYGDNVINNYAGSKWVIDGAASSIAGPHQSFTINYYTGATFLVNEVEKTFESLAWEKVIVNHKE